MFAVETLSPVLLLILLGWVLARIRFLGQPFMTDLNKLTYYVALPAFIVSNLAGVRLPVGESMRLFFLLLLLTLAAAGIAFVLGKLLAVRPASLGSVVQTAFRGNLAYAGLPVITYALAGKDANPETVGAALLVFAPLTAFYNVLGVVCLRPADSWKRPGSWKLVGAEILGNPLILACAAGFLLSFFSVPLPLVLTRALAMLGGAALPIALLCIGGAFISFRPSGHLTAVAVGAGVKVVLLPLMSWAACVWLDIQDVERLIVLVFSATPTAATAYVMAERLGGDKEVTSAIVAISTVVAMLSLTLVLLLGGA